MIFDPFREMTRQAWIFLYFLSLFHWAWTTCPIGFLKNENFDKCFYFSKELLSWENASKTCQNLDSELADLKE